MGFLARLFGTENRRQRAEKYRIGMAKTRGGALSSLKAALADAKHVDDALFDRLEEIFIMADIGVETVARFITVLREEVRRRAIEVPKDLENLIIDRMFDLYLKGQILDVNIPYAASGLTVILVVGVNGTGKTTSIGKLAHRIRNEGKKVLLAAGDTFRAGAIEQLKIWGERVGCPVEAKQEGADPAAVVFDALRRAKAERFDVLIVDTAGRLQNKINLMKELEKIGRTIGREVPPAAVVTYLVIDATTGQNGLAQAEVFNAATKITGIVLTKLDGTAKGGIVLAIRDRLGIPIHFVGLGEKLDDLVPFDIESYIYGLFADLFDKE